MKVSSIEVLRGFAVIFVVLYHLYAIQDRYFGINILPFFFEFGGLGVDIFFIISGIVMYKSLYGRGCVVKTKDFLISRISRIYPAYWLITLIVFALAQVRPELVNSSYIGTPSIVKSLFLFPDKTLPWLNVGWSLIYEMWFYILLGILIFLRKSFVIVIVISYGFFLLVHSNFYSDPVAKLVTDALIIEFLLGFFIGMLYFSSNVLLKTSKLLLISLASLAVLFFTFYFSLEISPRLQRLVFFGLSALAFVSLFIAYFDFFNGWWFSPFIYIGKISYSVYLTHILFLNAFIYVAVKVFDAGFFIFAVNFFSLIFAFICGAIYFSLVEAPLSKRLKLLLS